MDLREIMKSRENKAINGTYFNNNNNNNDDFNKIEYEEDEEEDSDKQMSIISSYRNNWKNVIKSKSLNNFPCSLIFHNMLKNETIIIHWVTFNGELPHTNAYIILPQMNKTINAYTNHCFCVNKYEKDEDKEGGYINPENINNVTNKMFLFAFTPMNLKNEIILTSYMNDNEDKSNNDTIYKICYKNNDNINNDIALEIINDKSNHLNKNLINKKNLKLTSKNKIYENMVICGFNIHYENKLFEKYPKALEILEIDLKAIETLLPFNIYNELKNKVKIWLNISIVYGKEEEEGEGGLVIGRGVCFHPNIHWLKENNENVNKFQCIEIYEISNYIEENGDRSRWGIGGIILHELCHAYHAIYLKDGYENMLIKNTFEIAMKSNQMCCNNNNNDDLNNNNNGKNEIKLYRNVEMHLPYSKPNITIPIAYCCTNCMEFFAELSVAYLGGINDVDEYNSHYPFNRKQLMEYDPKTFHVIEKIWQEGEGRCEEVKV